jgi:hypothetical protein
LDLEETEEMNDWRIAAHRDHTECSFEVLAQSVLSLDRGVDWIALEQAGCAPRWGWRDPSTGRVRTDIAPADVPAVDPLLFLVAEGGEIPAGGIAGPHGLLFVLLAYEDRTQIVARWGADAYVSVAVGTAVDAHVMAKKLIRLLDRHAQSAVVQ